MKIVKVTILQENYSTHTFEKSHELNINLEHIWFYAEGNYDWDRGVATTRITFSDKLNYTIDIPYKTFDILMKSDNHKLTHLFYTDGDNQ